MPVISVKGPKLDKEQKEELIQRFTEAASDVIELPEEAFIILLEETKKENVGVGGELLSEKEE